MNEEIFTIPDRKLSKHYSKVSQGELLQYINYLFEDILSQYLFEFNNVQTRKEIKNKLIEISTNLFLDDSLEK